MLFLTRPDFLVLTCTGPGSGAHYSDSLLSVTISAENKPKPCLLPIVESQVHVFLQSHISLLFTLIQEVSLKKHQQLLLPQACMQKITEQKD
jgi:hypothetical protein